MTWTGWEKRAVLPRTGVITRHFLALTAALVLLDVPGLADGPTARTKTQPPATPERFPPLPDLIARKASVDRRKERVGVVTKFVYWVRDSVTGRLVPSLLVADLDKKPTTKASVATSKPSSAKKAAEKGALTIIEAADAPDGVSALILPEDGSVAKSREQESNAADDEGPLFLDPLLVPASVTVQSTPSDSDANDNGLILPLDVPRSLDLEKPAAEKVLAATQSGAEPSPKPSTNSSSNARPARIKGRIREGEKVAASTVATAMGEAETPPAAFGGLAKVADMPSKEELEAAARKFEDALRMAAAQRDTVEPSPPHAATSDQPASGVVTASNVVAQEPAEPNSTVSPELTETLLEARTELAALAKQRASGDTSELEQARQELEAIAGGATEAIAIPKASAPPNLPAERIVELQSASAELAKLASDGRDDCDSAERVRSPQELLEAKSEMAAILGGELPKPELPAATPKVAQPPAPPVASEPPPIQQEPTPAPILPESAPAAPPPADPPKADSPRPPKTTEPPMPTTGLRFAKEMLAEELPSDPKPSTGGKPILPSAGATVSTEVPAPAPLPTVNTEEIIGGLPDLADSPAVSLAPSPDPMSPDGPAEAAPSPTLPGPKVRLLPAQPSGSDAAGESQSEPSASSPTSAPAKEPQAVAGPMVSLGSPSVEETDETPAVAPLVAAPTVEQCVQRLNSAARADQRIRALKDLGALAKWYVGPGAVDAVMRVATSNVEQPSRVLAVRMLGGVPRSTHKAAALLRGLAHSDRDAAVRQAAQNVLLERTAASQLGPVR